MNNPLYAEQSFLEMCTRSAVDEQLTAALAILWVLYTRDVVIHSSLALVDAQKEIICTVLSLSSNPVQGVFSLSCWVIKHCAITYTGVPVDKVPASSKVKKRSLKLGQCPLPP